LGHQLAVRSSAHLPACLCLVRLVHQQALALFTALTESAAGSNPCPLRKVCGVLGMTIVGVEKV
jgi:hypothetical protein